MKKIILTLVVLMFAITPVMAETQFDGAATPTILCADPADATNVMDCTVANAVEVVKASNNVYGWVLSSLNRFAATSVHLNGTYQYATSSEDTKIYRMGRAEADVGTTTKVLALSNSDTADFAAWKAL